MSDPMGQFGAYSSNTGQASSGGQFSFRNGVWLSKGEGARSDKYLKWTEDKTRTQFRQLDRQKHSSLVKLHSQSLEIRTELRGLQQQRSASSASTTHPAASTTPPAASKGPRKPSFSLSPTVSSIGHVSPMPSPRNPTSVNGQTSLSRGAEAGSHAGKGAQFSRRRQLKEGLNSNASAQKLKNIHSARALSKLRNDMDITH